MKRIIVVCETNNGKGGNTNVAAPNQEKLWRQNDLIRFNFAIELNKMIKTDL